MTHHEKRAAKIIFYPHVSIVADKHAGLIRVISNVVDEFKTDSDRDNWKASKQQVRVEKELHLLLVKRLIVPKSIDVHRCRNLIPIHKVVKPVERKIENLLAADEHSKHAENWRV